MNRDNDDTKGPIDEIPDGNLKASIWRNEGEKGPYYATEITRTYKDADGNLRDAHTFIGADLLKVSELPRKSYERTNELLNRAATARAFAIEKNNAPPSCF